MDPTLKKRLIGAAILIVLAAIVLPMFFGGPPGAPEGSTTLTLDIPPPPDRDLSEMTLPLAGAADDPDRVTPVDTADLPAPAAATVPSESATDPAPVAGPDPTAGTDPPAVPQQAPSPASSQAPATSPDGRFWVSLGSYGQAANADRVTATARARGITVAGDTVRTDGRDLTRLRAGPYASRASAEQARQLLLAALPDVRPVVQESAGGATADAPAPAPGAAASAGAWAVQVGAFAQSATAERLAARLRAAGHPAYVEPRGDVHAVRVGPFVRRSEAEAQRERLKSSQQLDGLIVAHPG